MRSILFVLICSVSICAEAQKNYFQQEVDYQIDVTLNDRSHILKGYESIKYKNNSPDTLKYLFFHLWPNAYKNDRTAFTAQQVENKDKSFYYSEDDDKGFIDSLTFKINGELVNTNEYNNLEDVIMIELNQALLPGASIDISTPFRVVLPKVFSRLGHAEQNYQISQWYPKPAVYDNKGWHPMPYLDQGEFYSEFGSYDVKITLPQNYVVAATGDMQEASEIAFVESRMLSADSSLLQKVDSTIVSSKEFKTITFKQKNVHDFAWFASKYFIVEKSVAKLSSGRSVDCYSFFKEWNRKSYIGSSDVTAKTIEYLSKRVGEYPYNHASIVDGTLLAGGGMEYPNVTVIGSGLGKKELQTVIIHEVGHNWFYGILGSNEREHPWMDEGMNSFYEQQLDRELNKSSINEGDKKTNFGVNLTKDLNGIFLYDVVAKVNEDQPINIHSKDYTNINYGGIVYKKTQVMMEYLQAYLGHDTFDKIMQAYFSAWKFKHPYPEDFEKIVKENTSKDVSWFFESGLNSTDKIDFKLLGIHKKVDGKTVVFAKSRTDFDGPIPISQVVGDSILVTQWIDFPYTIPAFFTAAKNSKYIIDAEKVVPEIKLNNNQKLQGLLGLKPKVLFGLGLSKGNEFFFLPAIGYNYYDKTMLGITMHNLRIPNNKFQFAIAPMYSFGAKTLVGTGVIGYSIFPKNTFQKVTLGLSARTFHDQESHLNISKSLYTRYTKFSPSVRFDLKKSSARSTVSNHILLQYVGIMNQSFAYTLNTTDSLYRPSVKQDDYNYFVRGAFLHKNARTFHPYSYRVQADGNGQFLKLSVTGNLRIDYTIKNKSFYVRAFAGKFFDFNTSTNIYALSSQYLASTSTAANDYTYGDVFVARNEQKGILSQQISVKDGGFKIRTNQYANPVGLNNNWLGAVNFRSDLPFKFPLKLQLFADAGTFANAKKLNPSGNNLLFDAGVELHLFGDMLIVYAPLFMSKDFKDYTKSVYSKNRLFNTMTFALNLGELNFLNTQSVTKMIGF